MARGFGNQTNNGTGALSIGLTPNKSNLAYGDQGLGLYDTQFNFNASSSNNIYTDNGKVLPLSISKQSYIIYK